MDTKIYKPLQNNPQPVKAKILTKASKQAFFV